MRSEGKADTGLPGKPGGEGTAKEGKPTPSAERAVRLLEENPNITARKFGLLMWPDSPHHERSQGSLEQGMAKGRVMWLTAGSYLHHLKRRGLVEIVPRSFGSASLWRAAQRETERPPRRPRPPENTV